MNKPVFFIFVFLIVANIFTWSICIPLFSANNELMLDFIDVGQGDSCFIKTSEGYKIIIDGGPDYHKAIEEINQEIPFWDREIDLMIITHPEQDHFIGLFRILKSYRVKNIVWSGVEKQTQSFENFKIAVDQEKQEGCRVFELSAGDKIIAGKTEMFILFPFDSTDKNPKKANSSAIVLKMSFDENNFLFPADIGSEEEKLIIESGQNIGADVLKVGHHGSKYSTSDEFLLQVSPKISVIQTGENSYGHPAEETLDRLEKNKIKTYRNDLNGGIKIISDGWNLKTIVDK
jgi:beta-lactamase superfamily II metal-dependent hydrolase